MSIIGQGLPEPGFGYLGSLSSPVAAVPDGMGWTESHQVLQEFKINWLKSRI